MDNLQAFSTTHQARQGDLPERPRLADHPELWSQADNVLANGACISFAQTARGTALSIVILDGEARHKTYVNSPAELADAVAWIEANYGGATKRPRRATR